MIKVSPFFRIIHVYLPKDLYDFNWQIDAGALKGKKGTCRCNETPINVQEKHALLPCYSIDIYYVTIKGLKHLQNFGLDVQRSASLMS